VKGEARRLRLAGCEKKLGASLSLLVNSHSIDFPCSKANLNRIVALICPGQDLRPLGREQLP